MTYEYSLSSSTAKKYYYAGSTRIAMRDDGSSLHWLLSDHLGSTVKAVKEGGSPTPEQRYRAWGETRLGSLPTNYRYTGQYEQPEIGLYWYNARWYDTYLNRWCQPDSKIPDSYNPLDWDRYSYVRNNPIIHTDPTGHNPLLILLGLAVAVGVWLAYPETAYAPEATFVPPTDVDQSYGEKAYFDAAPGTGDISDIYTALTGETLFTGEEVGLGGRILAGAKSIIPVGTASGITQVAKKAPIHHIATNKNWIRTPQWSARFQALFDLG